MKPRNCFTVYSLRECITRRSIKCRRRLPFTADWLRVKWLRTTECVIASTSRSTCYVNGLFVEIFYFVTEVALFFFILKWRIRSNFKSTLVFFATCFQQKLDFQSARLQLACSFRAYLPHSSRAEFSNAFVVKYLISAMGSGIIEWLHLNNRLGCLTYLLTCSAGI